MYSTRWIWITGMAVLAGCIAVAEATSASRQVGRIEHRISKAESDLREVRRDIDRIAGNVESLFETTDRIVEMLREMRAERAEIQDNSRLKR